MNPSQAGVFVKIHQVWDTNALWVVIGEQRGGKLYLATPVELVMVEHDEWAPIERPTLSLGGFLGQELLRAFADALDQHQVKPTTQSFIEGELRATKLHLSDLQKLVFHPPATGATESPVVAREAA